MACNYEIEKVKRLCKKMTKPYLIIWGETRIRHQCDCGKKFKEYINMYGEHEYRCFDCMIKEFLKPDEKEGIDNQIIELNDLEKTKYESNQKICVRCGKQSFISHPRCKRCYAYLMNLASEKVIEYNQMIHKGEIIRKSIFKNNPDYNQITFIEKAVKYF